jgi:hypothetical protein
LIYAWKDTFLEAEGNSHRLRTGCRKFDLYMGFDEIPSNTPGSGNITNNERWSRVLPIPEEKVMEIVHIGKGPTAG